MISHGEPSESRSGKRYATLQHSLHHTVLRCGEFVFGHLAPHTPRGAPTCYNILQQSCTIGDRGMDPHWRVSFDVDFRVGFGREPGPTSKAPLVSDRGYSAHLDTGRTPLK